MHINRSNGNEKICYSKQDKTYIPVRNAALLPHLGLIIVIDAEAREQDLIFILGQRAFEQLLGRGTVEAAALHEGPKGRVVEVVDVAFCSYVSVDGSR